MPDPIDLDFRPEAYFRPHPLEDYLLSRVKGTLYRERLRQLLQEGRRDEVMAFIGPDGVPAEVRKRLEALHPALMGGSYLPDAGEGEVEIGRIAIASTTRDVNISMRWSGSGWPGGLAGVGEPTPNATAARWSGRVSEVPDRKRPARVKPQPASTR